MKIKAYGVRINERRLFLVKAPFSGGIRPLDYL